MAPTTQLGPLDSQWSQQFKVLWVKPLPKIFWAVMACCYVPMSYYVITQINMSVHANAEPFTVKTVNKKTTVRGTTIALTELISFSWLA